MCLLTLLWLLHSPQPPKDMATCPVYVDLFDLRSVGDCADVVGRRLYARYLLCRSDQNRARVEQLLTSERGNRFSFGNAFVSCTSYDPYGAMITSSREGITDIRFTPLRLVLFRTKNR